MSTHNPPLDNRAGNLARTFGAFNIGTDLGAGYGAMAVIAYLLTTARWGRVINVATGATLDSARPGLTGGIKDIFIWLRAQHRRAHDVVQGHETAAR